MGLAEEDQAQTQVGSFFLLLFFFNFLFCFCFKYSNSNLVADFKHRVNAHFKSSQHECKHVYLINYPIFYLSNVSNVNYMHTLFILTSLNVYSN